MSRNSPAKAIWIANVRTVWGGEDIYMDEEEARRYNADPDTYAAKHFGLTKIEYFQWLDLEGAPLCSHRTKGGDLCRSLTGGFQLKASEWKARHRKSLCRSHATTKAEKRPK